MKTTKTFDSLVASLKSEKIESNTQLNYLFKILNGSNDELKQKIKEFFESENFENYELCKEQQTKGFDWLWDQWKSPTGKIRVSNPFGYREQEVLEKYDSIVLSGYYDSGNRYNTYYVPLYTVYSKYGYGFQYHVSGGKISIVG